MVLHIVLAGRPMESDCGMGPLFDSGPHGLRTVRNPLISGALQQCSKKLLVEPDSHNRPGPPPDWGPPGSRTGQLLKVVAGLSFVSPGLDLLVAHATSMEKVLTHGNIVYETQSQNLPLYRRTRQLDTTTEPNKRPRALPAHPRLPPRPRCHRGPPDRSDSPLASRLECVVFLRQGSFSSRESMG